MTEYEFKFLNLLKQQGKKKQDVAKLLGVTQPTLKSRLIDPDTFRVGEVKKVNKFLKTDILSL
jgi:predicted transcriptional regulator